MDRYYDCQQLLVKLEAVLRESEQWETTAPSRSALLSDQPFAIDTLTCSQWLQWIFIPKLGQLLVSNLPLPVALDISPYVEEAMAGQNNGQRILAVTRDIDQLFKQ
ncbi:YqcC family protein [Photobacterium nomapromontoriensis]|uniref:YqcC family protein n=1 Tax=Photobacterium nomapromontoriensis TaxID=2910237 RepID=UPI003D13C4AC